MAQKRTPGLHLKRGIWQIDKVVQGIGRIRCSTGETSLAAAERFLARETERLRNLYIDGIPIPHTFSEAAERYLNEITHNPTRDIQSLDALMPFIGQLDLRAVHDGTLREFVQARKDKGLKSATVKRDLAIVRRVLTLAARKWRDEMGNPWLQTVPMLDMPDWADTRKPYPLSWTEQRALLAELPQHLAKAVLYAVNTGLRDHSQAHLRWEWECPVPELGSSVFVIPAEEMKAGRDHVVVHNNIAAGIIEGCRGQHPEFVFTYDGRPVGRFGNSAWKKARIRAGLPGLRWHDLRHTFGRRLRACMVPLETRAALLGHQTGHITTHYSAAEVQELIDAVTLLETQRAGTLLRAVR